MHVPVLAYALRHTALQVHLVIDDAHPTFRIRPRLYLACNWGYT